MKFISGVSWVPVSACKQVPEAEDPSLVQESIREMRLSDGSAPTATDVDGDDAWENDMDSENDSDIADDILKDTDLVCLSAHACEDPYPAIEVFVYDTISDGLYVHHDVVLDLLPMCVSWLGNHNGQEANLCAVGDLMGGISLWNLDVRNVVKPIEWYGGKIGSKGKKYRPNSHQDAVLSVKWNMGAVQFMASSSGDGTIKLWDVNNSACVQTRDTIHNDKVQSIDWAPSGGEPFLLLSGGFDSVVCINDCRDPGRALRCELPSVPEQVGWVDATTFAVGCSDGTVAAFDARKTEDGPTAVLHAHEGNCVFSFNSHIRGLLATGGNDGLIKLWDIKSGGAKELVCHRLGVGEVFSIAFHPNNAEVLCAGGSGDKLLVYTVSEDLKRANFGES